MTGSILDVLPTSTTSRQSWGLPMYPAQLTKRPLMICSSTAFLQFSFSLKSSAVLCALRPAFSVSSTVFFTSASSSKQVYEANIRTLARHRDELQNVQCRSRRLWSNIPCPWADRGLRTSILGGTLLLWLASLRILVLSSG